MQLPPDNPPVVPTAPVPTHLDPGLMAAIRGLFNPGPAGPAGVPFNQDSAGNAMLQQVYALGYGPQSTVSPAGIAEHALPAPAQGGLGGEGEYGGDDYAHLGWGTAQPYDYANPLPHTTPDMPMGPPTGPNLLAGAHLPRSAGHP